MESINKYDVVVTTLKALDTYDVDALNDILNNAFVYSYANNFSKESVDDCLIVERQIMNGSPDSMYLKFILCTLVIDAVRYASRMDTPSEFTWERFFTWYANP